MKKIIINLFVLMSLLTGCSNTNEIIINGIKSKNRELNDIYLESDSFSKENNFITLIYYEDEKNSIYSNYFMIDDDIDLTISQKIIVEPCSLSNYDENNIKYNDLIINESDLNNYDVLILYTINNTILTSYPYILVVKSMYKMDIKANIVLQFPSYFENLINQ